MPFFIADKKDGLRVPEAEVKRKDLRKIKRDKEEKRKKNSDTNVPANNKEDSSPPFLSRIFGSRRSSRRLRKKAATPTPPSPQPQRDDRTPSPQQQPPPSLPSLRPPTEPVPVPKPRTIFQRPLADAEDEDEEEMEIDWRIPNTPPYHNYPIPQPLTRSIPAMAAQPRLVEKWAEADLQFVRAPIASPKMSRNELMKSTSPVPARHHRIHIAGLSPYQRRVARIGNGLEISDDEWDQPEPTVSPTRSYHFRSDGRERSDLSLNLENQSLPVNINHDFILKRASPVPTAPPPSSAMASEHLRRSFEILKFSNEGLKKTIDSLNPKRMSQSSDQLHLSDASGHRESSGSISNSTSSLNISDADADTNGSTISLIQSADDEKDVRDDVLIVEDHKEAGNHEWPESSKPTGVVAAAPTAEAAAEEYTEDFALQPIDSPSSHLGIPDFTPPPFNRKLPVSNNNNNNMAGSNGGYEADGCRSKPPTPEELVRPKPKSWETRQMAVAPTTPDPPVFSMSVRVQNPPDVKFKRSVSNPNGDPSPSMPYTDQQQQHPSMVSRKMSDSFPISRPFIMSVRMGTDSEAAPSATPLPAQQLMAKLSARPWQSKEEKERQNKVASTAKSQQEPQLELDPPTVKAEQVESVQPSVSAEVVKLRPKKAGTSEETSELLKVFARRSLKVRDSRDFTDVGAVDPEVRNVVESTTPTLSSHQNNNNNNNRAIDDTPEVVVQQSTEKTDLPKEKAMVAPPPVKKLPKPPVAVRTAMPVMDDKLSEQQVDRHLKSSGRAPPFFRPAFHDREVNVDNHSVPNSARPAAALLIRLPADEKSIDAAADLSCKTTPLTSSPTGCKVENGDTNRIITESSSTAPDEVVWKKLQPIKPRSSFAPSHKFAAKNIDDVYNNLFFFKNYFLIYEIANFSKIAGSESGDSGATCQAIQGAGYGPQFPTFASDVTSSTSR